MHTDDPGEHAGDDHQADVPVDDVGQLVRQDALHLVAGQSLEQPPRDGDPADPKPRGKKGGKGRDGGGKKKKKKGTWWKILLITLLVIVLIFGGAYALIMGAIAPKGGSIKLNQLVNTPKEFQDKELNVLVTGVDRSSTGDLSAGLR